MAGYCIAPFFAVAPKPAHLSHVEAASVPISGLTAWQALFERAMLQSGERVLVHGGAGTVGIFAIQLARLYGAKVVATTSASNAELVRKLGAEHVIDYRASRFEESVNGFDVIFDTAGGETLERSWSLLKPGGRMATIAPAAERSGIAREQAFFIVQPNQKQLVHIADLLDAGRLRVVVDTVVPLSRAPEAFRRQGAKAAPRKSGGCGGNRGLRIGATEHDKECNDEGFRDPYRFEPGRRGRDHR